MSLASVKGLITTSLEEFAILNLFPTKPRLALSSIRITSVPSNCEITKSSESTAGFIITSPAVPSKSKAIWSTPPPS